MLVKSIWSFEFVQTRGISFFDKLDKDIPLHLVEVKAYKSGMVELCYEVQGRGNKSQDTI